MSIRSSGAFALLVALLVAGCGSSAATSAPADVGTGSGSGATPAASADAGSGTADTPAPAAPVEPGGGAAEDAAKVGEQLVPPNSTEAMKTTTDTYWYVTYESTDSPDALKAYYESQIPKTGLKIISTTSVSGSYVWVIARDEFGRLRRLGHGGAVGERVGQLGDRRGRQQLASPGACDPPQGPRHGPAAAGALGGAGRARRRPHPRRRADGAGQGAQHRRPGRECGLVEASDGACDSSRPCRHPARARSRDRGAPPGCRRAGSLNHVGCRRSYPGRPRVNGCGARQDSSAPEQQPLARVRLRPGESRPARNRHALGASGYARPRAAHATAMTTNGSERTRRRHSSRSSTRRSASRLAR